MVATVDVYSYDSATVPNCTTTATNHTGIGWEEDTWYDDEGVWYEHYTPAAKEPKEKPAPEPEPPTYQHEFHVQGLRRVRFKEQYHRSINFPRAIAATWRHRKMTRKRVPTQHYQSRK